MTLLTIPPTIVIVIAIAIVIVVTAAAMQFITVYRCCYQVLCYCQTIEKSSIAKNSLDKTKLQTKSTLGVNALTNDYVEITIRVYGYIIYEGVICITRKIMI